MALAPRRGCRYRLVSQNRNHTVAFHNMPLPAFQLLEKKFEKQIRLFELRRGAIEKKIETHFRPFEEKNRVRLDDEVRFIRPWIEKPLSIGAVTPSSRVLARAMAAYVDPDTAGPVIELGPGTGPI